ncbi:MAG: CHAD domain-containing protein [Pseudomonadota bacterium]
MTEIEFKLLVEEAMLPALKRRIGARAEGRGVIRKLRSIYLDTVDQRLAAGGVALRLRLQGRRWSQTVKRARRHTAGLSEADEVTTEAPGGRVALGLLPQAVRDEIIALKGDLPLAPQFETDMSRTLWTVPLQQGRAEVALDKGMIRAEGREEPLIELEMELLEGSPAHLFDLARAVVTTGPVRLSATNKATRGRRVADGLPAVLAPGPRNAVPIILAKGASVDDATAAILAECVGQVMTNVTALRASSAPEGAHQLRVGLRRLRSALMMLMPAITGEGGADLSALAYEARWLAGEVGGLRDLQVAEMELVAPAAVSYSEEPGFARLGAALRDRAGETYATLLATLDGPRATAFLLDLAALVALRGWTAGEGRRDKAQAKRLARPFSKLARKAVIKAERRVMKRAVGIETLDHEARHDLRKAMKTLRYTVEFAAPNWPDGHVRGYVKSVKKVQNLFGTLNDAAMGEALFMSDDAPGMDDPAAARAAGRLIGASLVAADHDWAQALERWAVFEATPRPWH